LPEARDARPEVVEKLEVQIKYAGYVRRQERDVASAAQLEAHEIPAGLDFTSLAGLSTEAAQKLTRMRPAQRRAGEPHRRRARRRLVAPAGALAAAIVVSDTEQLPAIVDEAVTVLPEAIRPEGLEAALCGYLLHLLERNREVNLVSRRDTVNHLARFHARMLVSRSHAR
jgi:ATP-dependent exoDNAse (exonuclease V) alpha subunit